MSFVKGVAMNAMGISEMGSSRTINKLLHSEGLYGINMRTLAFNANHMEHSVTNRRVTWMAERMEVKPPANRLDLFAQCVSFLTYPTTYCALVFVVINMTLLAWPEWIITTMVCILFASVIPAVCIAASAKKTGSVTWTYRKGQPVSCLCHRRCYPTWLARRSYTCSTCRQTTLS
jgi:hypothetical protein